MPGYLTRLPGCQASQGPTVSVRELLCHTAKHANGRISIIPLCSTEKTSTVKVKESGRIIRMITECYIRGGP